MFANSSLKSACGMETRIMKLKKRNMDELDRDREYRNVINPFPMLMSPYMQQYDNKTGETPKH
jgi:hypothetical protein